MFLKFLTYTQKPEFRKNMKIFIFLKEKQCSSNYHVEGSFDNTNEKFYAKSHKTFHLKSAVLHEIWKKIGIKHFSEKIGLSPTWSSKPKWCCFDKPVKTSLKIQLSL